MSLHVPALLAWVITAYDIALSPCEDARRVMFSGKLDNMCILNVLQCALQQRISSQLTMDQYVSPPACFSKWLQQEGIWFHWVTAMKCFTLQAVMENNKSQPKRWCLVPASARVAPNNHWLEAVVNSDSSLTLTASSEAQRSQGPFHVYCRYLIRTKGL